MMQQKGRAKKWVRSLVILDTHSRLVPIVNAAKILKCHRPGPLAYTRHRITNAVAEATNATIRPTMRMLVATATSRSTASQSSFIVGCSTYIQPDVHLDSSSAYPHETRKSALNGSKSNFESKPSSARRRTLSNHNLGRYLSLRLGRDHQEAAETGGQPPRNSTDLKPPHV